MNYILAHGSHAVSDLGQMKLCASWALKEVDQVGLHRQSAYLRRKIMNS